MLSKCAQLSNKTKSLAVVKDPKSRPRPKVVRDSARCLLNLHRKLRKLQECSPNNASKIDELKIMYSIERTKHR